MRMDDFFINNCYRGNFCRYWESTGISEICKHPKCKGMGPGEQNEINRAIICKCMRIKLYVEQQKCEKVEESNQI